MIRGDRKDILGGLILMSIGGYGLYGAYSFNIGTARQMGPGYFPLMISTLLMVLGGVILAIALRSAAKPIPRPQMRPVLAVLVSILAFGLTLNRIGLIPSLFLVTVIASLGDRSSRPIQTVLLALGISVGCWLVFVRLLGLSLPTMIWPF